MSFYALGYDHAVLNGFPEMVGLAVVVSRPGGQPVVPGNCHAYRVVTKGCGGDRGCELLWDSQILDQFFKRPTDWEEHSETLRQGILFCFGSGQTNRRYQLVLPDQWASG